MDWNCSWVIQSSFSNGPDYVVKVIFDDFYRGGLRRYNTSCNFKYYGSAVDTLSFYDGMSPMSRHLGTYCDGTHPDVIYSTGQFLFVKFHAFSRHYGPDGKFKISFIAVKKGTEKLLLAFVVCLF